MNHTDAIEIQSESDPLILVLDVPLTATTAETALLLDTPCSQGYYVAAAVPWPGVGARVILRRYAAKPTAAKTSSNNPVTSKEARAMEFMRENRDMTSKELAAGIKALGFPRSAAWAAKKRADIIRMERRVT